MQPSREQGAGCRVQPSREQGAGCRVQASREQGVGCGVQASREQGAGCGVQARRPSASRRSTLTLALPAQLCYEAEDAAEPTWDHPHVRLGGWRFERVREGRRLADDIRTVESRRQSAVDGARYRLLRRP